MEKLIITFTPNTFTPTLGTYRAVRDNLIRLYTRVPSVEATPEEFSDITSVQHNVVSLRADAILERGYVSVTVKDTNGTEHTGLVVPSLTVGIQWGSVVVTVENKYT